jgi:citrate synthase
MPDPFDDFTIGGALDLMPFWFETTQEIPHGQKEIAQGRARRSGTHETSRRRGHAWKQSHQPTDFLQAPRQVQILEEVHFPKASELKEDAAPDKHRLIAKMPTDQTIAPAREKTGQAQQSGRRSVAPCKSAAHYLRIL